MGVRAESDKAVSILGLVVTCVTGGLPLIGVVKAPLLGWTILGLGIVTVIIVAWRRRFRGLIVFAMAVMLCCGVWLRLTLKSEPKSARATLPLVGNDPPRQPVAVAPGPLAARRKATSPPPNLGDPNGTTGAVINPETDTASSHSPTPPAQTPRDPKQTTATPNSRETKPALPHAAAAPRTFFGYHVPNSDTCVEILFSSSEFPPAASKGRALESYFRDYLKATQGSAEGCETMQTLQLVTKVQDNVASGSSVCIEVEITYLTNDAQGSEIPNRSGTAVPGHACYGSDSERAPKSATENAFANLSRVIPR